MPHVINLRIQDAKVPLSAERSPPRLKNPSKVTNDIDVLDTRQRQLQLSLCREWVNYTEGPCRLNKCDRRACLRVGRGYWKL